MWLQSGYEIGFVLQNTIPATNGCNPLSISIKTMALDAKTRGAQNGFILGSRFWKMTLIGFVLRARSTY